MKNIIKKTAVTFSLVVCVAGFAGAQQLKTDVSVSEQYTQNKVPGLQYKTAAHAPVQAKAQKQDVQTFMSEMTPNVPVTKTVAKGASTNVQAPAATGLASDAKVSASPAKKAEATQPDMQGGTQPKEEAVKQAAKTTMPTQE